MDKWKTEDHFVSWLRLCPDNRISGNKVIGKGRLPTNNPVSIALKIAASSLKQSKTYLGAQFRRLRTRLGAPIAIKAMAGKLARLVYRMLRYGMKYVDKERPSTSFNTESADPAGQVDSCQDWIPNRPSSSRLKKPDLLRRF